MVRFPRLKAGMDGLASFQGVGGIVIWLALVIGAALKGFDWPIVLLVAILGLAGILLAVAAAAYLFHGGEANRTPPAPAFYQAALEDAERVIVKLQARVDEVTQTQNDLFGTNHLLAVQIGERKREIEVLRRQLTDMTTRELRILWQGGGKETVERALSLVRTALEKIRDEHVDYRALLREKIQSLETNSDRLSASLSDDTTVLLEQIRENLGAVGVGYLEVLKWVARFRDDGAADFSDDRLDAGLRNWMRSYSAFMDEVRRFENTPEHRGTLKVWPHAGADQGLIKLLHDAWPG